MKKSGELGLGSYDNSHPTPQQVGILLNWAAARIGAEHACGITDSGALRCWGSSYFGRTGLADAWPDGPTRILEPSKF
jgi:hypothetical protein